MPGAGNRAKQGQWALGRSLQSWTQSSASCFGPFWLRPALALCSPSLSALEGLSGVPVWRWGAGGRSLCRAGGAAGRSRAGAGAAALSAASAMGSSAPGQRGRAGCSGLIFRVTSAYKSVSSLPEWSRF